MTPKRTVRVPGARLEVLDDGAGEPVVFVQTALTADEERPVADDPALAAYRRLRYHRRGYAGSSPATGAGSIRRDAADCLAVLAGLGVGRVHAVGASYAAAVALQLSADAPDLVDTLTIVEPPPVVASETTEFRAVARELQRVRAEEGVDAALEAFMDRLVGGRWRAVLEQQLPGAVAQVEADAATFFDTDMPALLGWRFGANDARRITCPVLAVHGADSGPWFAEVRDVVGAWFPGAQRVVIDGAGHDVMVSHPTQVARALATFLRRHRL